MSLNQIDLKIVMQVTVQLENNYRENHTHSSLANDYYINEKKLRTIFKIVNGKTINDFLTGVRIERAKEYLSSTSDPVKKVAFNVGLGIRTLEKHFKKYTGKTPLEWRQQEAGLPSYITMNAIKRKE
jgi:two-component system response regulator YesN